MPFYFIDYWYIIFCVPPLILALFAQYKVNFTYKKYSKVTSGYGMTGADAARMVLRQNGVAELPIKQISGNLTDHFDPRNNTISLSQDVYGSASVAAVGIAAHEAGHAVQHSTGYAPIKLRSKLVPVANIGSQAGIWLAVLGIAFATQTLAYVGVGLYLFFVLFQLVTLPVEFNASNRAIAALEGCGRFTEEELIGSKRVLRAAALTYVAALASSVGMLLRLLAVIGGGNSRSRR